MNEPLRQALLRARLREDDVAARLGVDPKTVRRWLNGRVPYANNRAAIADLVGADEADLWPDAGGPLAARSRPEELGTVYPHRWSVPARYGRGSSGLPSTRSPSWPTARCSSPRTPESCGSSPIRAGQASPSGSRSETQTAEHRRTRRRRRHRRCHARQDPQCAHAVPAATRGREHRDPAAPDRPVQLDLPRRRPAHGQSAHLRRPRRASTHVLPTRTTAAR